MVRSAGSCDVEADAEPPEVRARERGEEAATLEGDAQGRAEGQDHARSGLWATVPRCGLGSTRWNQTSTTMQTALLAIGTHAGAPNVGAC